MATICLPKLQEKTAVFFHHSSQPRRKYIGRNNTKKILNVGEKK
jgi:hypothetical protein